MKLRPPAGLVAGLVSAALLPVAPAGAAPVTVNLRVETATRTVFEGPITTDVRPFRFTGEPTGHTCDGTSATGGPSATPVPTRGAAIARAAEAAPFAIGGTWHEQFGATFETVAGEPVAFNPATQQYLVEYENGEGASLGACADDIQPGDDVLFAFARFGDRVLELAGPAIAPPGVPVAVRVTDAGTGVGVGGATVAGATTAADGTASIGPFTARGAQVLKAEKAGMVRSNRLRVCVTDGADGACGTRIEQPPARDTTAPTVTILGIRMGQHFSRRRAPRELRGAVSADPSGLRAVKLRLTRRLRGTRWYFSGSKERFVKRRCGKPPAKRRCGKPPAFKVGESTDWSYLLPARLRRGRYVLEAYAIDRASNRGKESRVVFRVR
jgi:hypothetical protein